MRQASLRWMAPLVAILSIALSGCGEDKGKTSPYDGPIKMIWDGAKGNDEAGYVFQPNDVEVEAGVPVQWINKKVGDRIMFHTATCRSKGPKGDPYFRLTAGAADHTIATNAEGGDSVTFTDADKGKTFEYFCEQRGHVNMQKATITVKK